MYLNKKYTCTNGCYHDSHKFSCLVGMLTCEVQMTLLGLKLWNMNLSLDVSPANLLAGGW